jgi:hypothetical protein
MNGKSIGAGIAWFLNKLRKGDHRKGDERTAHRIPGEPGNGPARSPGSSAFNLLISSF